MLPTQLDIRPTVIVFCCLVLYLFLYINVQKVTTHIILIKITTEKSKYFQIFEKNNFRGVGVVRVVMITSCSFLFLFLHL
jgi:hypothetical protein